MDRSLGDYSPKEIARPIQRNNHCGVKEERKVEIFKAMI